MRKTKIVCTIGPSSEQRKIIHQMIENGMDVARLNFSHGNYEWFENIVKIIREEAGKLNKAVAIIGDLQGIKIRISDVENDEVELKEKQTIEIYPGSELSNNNKIFISYPLLLEDIKPGEDILIDDGLLKIKIIEKHKDKLIGKVIEGGILKSRKGVNLPFTRTSISSLTEKDKSDLAFAIKLDIDYVAVSFVRSAQDIELIKKMGKDSKY